MWSWTDSVCIHTYSSINVLLGYAVYLFLFHFHNFCDTYILASIWCNCMKFNIEDIYQGLNFRVGWWDLNPKFKNPIKKNHKGGTLPPWKIPSFLGNFCFYKTKLFFSEKFADFRVLLNNFLSVCDNSLLLIRGIVFRFYQELNV